MMQAKGKGKTKAEKVRLELCHWDDETGEYKLLRLPATAFAAHKRQHALDVLPEGGACPVPLPEDEEPELPLSPAG